MLTLQTKSYKNVQYMYISMSSNNNNKENYYKWGREKKILSEGPVIVIGRERLAIIDTLIVHLKLGLDKVDHMLLFGNYLLLRLQHDLLGANCLHQSCCCLCHMLIYTSL